jgi:hypothetical protein
VGVDQCVSAVRAVEVPVLVCLGNKCSHVAEVSFARFMLNVVTQNDWDFVGVILLYHENLWVLSKWNKRPYLKNIPVVERT